MVKFEFIFFTLHVVRAYRGELEKLTNYPGEVSTDLPKGSIHCPGGESLPYD